MRNLTLLTDLYQLTMLNGYFEKNIHEDMVIFDMFFRKNACNGGYTIVCGIEQFVEYINNIHFLLFAFGRARAAYQHPQKSDTQKYFFHI